MPVAWTAPEKGGTPDQIVEHAVTLPESVKGAKTTIDLFGAESPLLFEDGHAVLRLQGSPQCVAY
jgi:hypothetical protein